MRSICVAITKGGTAKTTTAVTIAHGLAMRGHKVLLVDVDSQGQCARALGLPPSVGLAEVIAGDLAPSAAILQARPGLWLLAGGRGLALAKREISRRDVGSEWALSEALAPLGGDYETMILDTAPGWDVLTVNALFASGEVLAPVSLEPLALVGLAEFGVSLGAIQRYHAAPLTMILPTFADRRRRQTGELLAQLQARYGPLVCDPIRATVRLSECAAFGATIWEHDPHGNAAEDYTRLLERIDHANT
jgi:chromosome partitioning protein